MDNTMSNEMHHKQSKNAATTRRPQEFDFQVGTRCHESDRVNLTHVEITTDVPMFMETSQKSRRKSNEGEELSL
jgi:hypothetical protein